MGRAGGQVLRLDQCVLTSGRAKEAGDGKIHAGIIADALTTEDTEITEYLGALRVSAVNLSFRPTTD